MWRWATALGRTPRELLATVTSDEITEAMAFERLEPFGSLHLEQMLGQVCAAIINPHLRQGAEPAKASDFMPALARALNRYRPANEPVLLDNPEAQAALIKARIFGVAPTTAPNQATA